MRPVHDPIFVVVSLVIAGLTGYAVLDLVHSLWRAERRAGRGWLVGLALAMGFGVWSTHFVGVLAMEIPGVTSVFDAPLLALALAVAVLASAVAVVVLAVRPRSKLALLGASVALAAGFAGMHYLGVAATRLPVGVRWDPALVVVSLGAGAATAFLGAWLATTTRPEQRVGRRVAGAAGIGVGLAAMHYTAALSMRIVQDGGVEPVQDHDLVGTDALAAIVAVTSLLGLAIAVGSAIAHRALAARQRQADLLMAQIRETEAARAELAEVSDALQAVFRSAPLALAAIDPDGRVRQWSEAAERMFGWTAEEVSGQPLPIIPDDRLGEHARLRDAALAGVATHGVETTRCRRDGSAVDVALSVAPLRHADGQIRGVMAIMEDITGRRSAERARQHREGQLRAVLEVLPVGVRIGDRRGATVALNRSMRELWGGDPGDFGSIAGWWADTGRPVSHGEWGHVRALRGELCESQEMQVESLDGRRRTILAYAAPILDDSDSVGGSVEVHVDITGRRAREDVERFLAETARSLGAALDEHTLLERIGQAVVPRLADVASMFVVRDGELERRAVVGGAFARSEREANAAIGAEHPVRQVVRDRRSLLLEEVDEESLAALVSEDMPVERLRALRLRALLVVPLVLRDEARGAMVLAVMGERTFGPEDQAVAEQVGDRAAVALENARLFREVERRAREEEALRQAAAAVSESFTTDEVVQQVAESAIRALAADGAVVERLDLTGDELEIVAVAGQAPDVRTRVGLRDSLAERVLELQDAVRLVDSQAAERDVLRHVRMWCPGGSVIAAPLLDAGEPLGALLVMRNASRRPFDDEDLERARVFADLASLTFRKIHLLEESEGRREELEKVDASRAKLVRGFSHDVRNPLNVAVLHLQLLERGRWGELPAEQSQVLDTVTRSIREAVSLMDDLVDLARAQASQITVDLRPTNIDRATEEMVGEYRAAAEAKGLSLTMSGPAGLTMIESDPSRVRQVLGNLVSNAVKYTAEGTVTVSVDKRAEGPKPGPWIAVTVADTGPGIPQEQHALLFEEFTRVSDGREPGLGVGLAIAKRIAEALGGTITLESTVGRGSSFTLWLPQRRRSD